MDFQIDDATGASQLSSLRVNLDRLEADTDNALQGHKNELEALELKHNKKMASKLSEIDSDAILIMEKCLKELEKIKSF